MVESHFKEELIIYVYEKLLIQFLFEQIQTFLTFPTVFLLSE